MTPETKDKFREFVNSFQEKRIGHLDITKWGPTLKDSVRTRFTLSIGRVYASNCLLQIEFMDQQGQRLNFKTFDLPVDEAVERFTSENAEDA